MICVQFAIITKLQHRPASTQPPPSTLPAASFSPWGLAEGIEGPQVTVEPGPIRALLRYWLTFGFPSEKKSAPLLLCGLSSEYFDYLLAVCLMAAN